MTKERTKRGTRDGEGASSRANGKTAKQRDSEAQRTVQSYSSLIEGVLCLKLYYTVRVCNLHPRTHRVLARSTPTLILTIKRQDKPEGLFLSVALLSSKLVTLSDEFQIFFRDQSISQRR